MIYDNDYCKNRMVWERFPDSRMEIWPYGNYAKRRVVKNIEEAKIISDLMGYRLIGVDEAQDECEDEINRFIKS